LFDLNLRLALLTSGLEGNQDRSRSFLLHVGIAKAHEERLPARRRIAMAQNMNPPNQGNQQNSPSQGNQGGSTQTPNKPGQGTVKDPSQTGNKK
jgi:hypothetical protein